MSDILSELAAVHRETGRRPVRAGEARTVVLRRDYEAAIEDVWDAVTNPERIGRWFLPVTGDLRLGGRYQFQGNAGGEIVRCEPPRLLTVTWVFGEEPGPDDVSEVEVRLSDGPTGGTVLELSHVATVPAERWAQYGPGATGVGWDMALLGLAMHLRGEHLDDPEAWVGSAEGREALTYSSAAWGAANRAGGATDEEAAAAERNTTAFYVP